MREVIREDDLHFAYGNALRYVKQRCYPKEERAAYRNDLLRRMDVWMIKAKDPNATECEKQKILLNGKNIYKDYCAFGKGHPDENTEQLQLRAKNVEELLVNIEARSISLYRIKLEECQYIDAQRIFTVKQYVREFLNNPLTTVLEHAIENKKFRAIREYHQYYISDYGKRYHVEECRYCKNRNLHMVSEQECIKLGVTPCKCVIRANIEELRALNSNNEKKYITAYVDESIRLNPAHIIDNKLDEYQNLIGAVICKGRIRKEENITKGNTLTQFVRIAERTTKTGETAMEAIGQVLIKCASMGFHDRVVIYTDNHEAASHWKENTIICALSKLFESVNVHQIGRKCNKHADSIIRGNDIMILPINTMKDIVQLYTNKLSLGENEDIC